MVKKSKSKWKIEVSDSVMASLDKMTDDERKEVGKVIRKLASSDNPAVIGNPIVFKETGIADYVQVGQCPCEWDDVVHRKSRRGVASIYTVKHIFKNEGKKVKPGIYPCKGHGGKSCDMYNIYVDAPVITDEILKASLIDLRDKIRSGKLHEPR